METFTTLYLIYCTILHVLFLSKNALTYPQVYSKYIQLLNKQKNEIYKHTWRCLRIELIWFTKNSLYFCKKVHIFEEHMCNYVQILDSAEYS